MKAEGEGEGGREEVLVCLLKMKMVCLRKWRRLKTEVMH